MLLKVESMTLSEIARELEKRGFGMTIAAVLKHVKKLERAGILRSTLANVPEARKTIYSLEGRERVKKIMKHVREVAALLEAGKMFCETEKIALKIQTRGRNVTEEDLQKFRSMLSRWDSEEVKKHLEENERRNIELWKTLLTR